MTTIGELRKFPFESESAFEWKIENFAALSMEEDKLYISPEFTFAANTWVLKLYPNGQKHSSIGFMDLILCRKFPDDPILVEFSQVIKAENEDKDFVRYFTRVFEGYDAEWGDAGVLERNEISLNMSEFAADNIFTIICTLKYLEPEDSSDEEEETDDCQYCGKNLKVEDISFHERRCLEKPIKCEECRDVLKLKSWFKHLCYLSRMSVYEEMFDYFKYIMKSGEHSDTIIKVGEIEFRLHRNILTARNPFFKAMFNNEMKEKASGIVTINDCEPNLFRLFVHFLYLGKLDDLSQENACGLYEIADRYQDKQLKEICLNFIENSICVENFCKYISLAMKFDEKILLEKAVKFFIARAKDIIPNEAWQNFTREHPTKANELFIKALDKIL